ncbi:RND efflux system, outer membrane lipoprotein, NodT family, partial [hydrothermal vent metagenome]
TIFKNASSDWLTDGAVDAAIAKDWSVILQDQTMLALIDEALAYNPSLRSSAERVARSKAILRQSRSSFFPRLDVDASGNARTPLENSGFVDRYSGGLNASWEVDIWGRIRAGIVASQFDLASSKAFYRNAREALIAETARSYVAVIEAKKQRALNQETLSALQGTLRIVDIRHKLGAASRRETVLALSDVASANDSLEVADANVRATSRALEVLLGRYPTASIIVPDIFPDINPAIAAGRPADILRRRPDIRLAENAVQSAFAGVDVQVRTNWPRLTLSSDLSGAGANFGDLFDPASLAFSVGLRLADNLFDGGLTKGRIEVAKSDGRQALAVYGQTVLDAFAEVESQLDAAMVLDRRRNFV